MTTCQITRQICYHFINHHRAVPFFLLNVIHTAFTSTQHQLCSVLCLRTLPRIGGAAGHSEKCASSGCCSPARALREPWRMHRNAVHLEPFPSRPEIRRNQLVGKCIPVGDQVFELLILVARATRQKPAEYAAVAAAAVCVFGPTHSALAGQAIQLTPGSMAFIDTRCRRRSARFGAAGFGVTSAYCIHNTLHTRTHPPPSIMHFEAD